jgi:hypothetical protein
MYHEFESELGFMTFEKIADNGSHIQELEQYFIIATAFVFPISNRS